MFFPNRFQPKTQADDQEITEFHGPPATNQDLQRISSPSPREQKGRPVPRMRRYSAPPPTTPRLLPISTPPEKLRGSFFQVFKPTLDELSKPSDALPKKETSSASTEDRPPTPISMMMLKTEF